MLKDFPARNHQLMDDVGIYLLAGISKNLYDVGIYLVAGISFRQFYQKNSKNFVFRTRMKFIIDNQPSIKFGIFIFQFMNSNKNIL